MELARIRAKLAPVTMKRKILKNHGNLFKVRLDSQQQSPLAHYLALVYQSHPLTA